jgi:beta-lactamase superfamily II metal-dependent hydrolase
MTETTVAVRMYNVGFGDAFLVSVARGGAVWRMLVDCGVHAHGRARPIREVVAAIIADLAEAAPPGAGPRLDVLVATHRHADHISGFAYDDWDRVEVGQVWLPFVANPEDPDTRALAGDSVAAAKQLQKLISVAGGKRRAAWPEALTAADLFAVNCLGNADAMDRLLAGRFATTAEVRFLPDRGTAGTVIDTGLPGVRMHVLGPPRDRAHLRRMDPPASVAWLARRTDPGTAAAPEALFPAVFVVPEELVGDEQRAVATALRLPRAGDEVEDLLAAAAALEGAVNNTSLFLVLDVAGTRLVFPGDAQQGGWDHVLDDPGRRALVSAPVFYKVSHHGSHNATPRRYVTEALGRGAHAMLPWGLVPRWADSIPKQALLDALAAQDTHLIRADAPTPAPHVQVHGDLWSEVTFTIAYPEGEAQSGSAHTTSSGSGGS